MEPATTSLSQEQFDLLFRQCERKFLCIAFNYVRDSAAAHDIVNDSFMTLWEHRDSVVQTNIEAYIYRIVQNKCLQYRRNQKIGKTVFEKIEAKERIVRDYYTRTIESCNPDELFQSEMMAIFQSEMKRMPQLTCEIFLAHSAEGKTYKEIAEQFNVTPKKVDKELQQAASKLRLSLKDYLMIVITLFGCFKCLFLR